MKVLTNCVMVRKGIGFVMEIKYIYFMLGNTYKMLLASQQVECLKGSGHLNFEDIKFENENVVAVEQVEEDSESDSSDTSELLLDDP